MIFGRLIRLLAALGYRAFAKLEPRADWRPR